jgi:hypothetical protein
MHSSWYYMAVSGYLHIPAVLPSGEETPLLTGHTAELSSQSVSDWWRRETFVSLPGIEPWSSASRYRHYFVCVAQITKCIPTETCHVTLHLGTKFDVFETWIHFENISVFSALLNVATMSKYQFNIAKCYRLP